MDLNQIIPSTATGSTMFFQITAAMAAKPATLLKTKTASNGIGRKRYLFAKEWEPNVENRNLTRCTWVSWQYWKPIAVFFSFFHLVTETGTRQERETETFTLNFNFNPK